ncbi:MAG TPA: phosphatidylglycerophosphatase A [Woeseiaceae bacterium]|nr:phosphatidylglycerophosphatase A [Woeseiaceae bacterium]
MISDRELRRAVLHDPVHFLAFGFGSGLAPRAPGTAGSLMGVLCGWCVLPLGPGWRIAIGVALVAAGVWLCGESARRIGVHDHPGIVWDEIAGMYLVLLVTPAGAGWWLLAFAMFRLFDIWKPWPIRDLDHRLAGGAGIMLDDIAAAFYAALVLVCSHGLAGWVM